MALPVADNDRLLTISFPDKNLEDVTLQYHPSVLSLTERNNSTTTSGLDTLITYIAPENTTDNNIRINSYFTAIIPNQDAFPGATFDPSLAKNAVNLTTVIFATAAIGGRKVLDVLDAGFSVISLAKGVYDIGAGLITPNFISPSPVGLADKQLQKLVILSDAINKSVPCHLNWDIALDVFPVNTYIINSMEVNVQDIQEETGITMTVEVGLNLIKQGTRVEAL